MLTIISFVFFITVFLLSALWILVPAIYGLPSIPTKHKRIRKALKLVNLQPDEILFDLGAGDGRVLLIAVREFGAKAVGIEIGPVQCVLIWLRLVASRFSDRAKIQLGNYYHADLKNADVVFVYATSKEVVKLASQLKRQLKHGARVVSISADFPEWEPTAFDERELIFVYHMPPREGNLTTYLLRNAK